jgi:hypothetical protein
MLVWSVESAVLGLWALALASASPSALHVFMARSHAILSGFTMVAQLFLSARRLSGVAQAVSDAFVCVVWALFVMYLVVVLDPGNFGNTRLFSMPVLAGTLPLDAWVGLGWFVAAAASAIGMGLGGERPSRLMFHPFGYHLLITAPSLMAVGLYFQEDTPAEPVTQGIGTMLTGASITHTLYVMMLAGIWAVFIVLQATGQALSPPSDGQWTGWLMLAWALKLIGRAACIVIPVAAALSVRTGAQAVLMWTLVAIGILNAVDWIQALEWLLNEGWKRQQQMQPETTQNMSAHMRPPDPAALHIKEF